jgi:hypothetical protein
MQRVIVNLQREIDRKTRRVEQTLHKLTLTLNNSEKIYECAILRKDLRVV